MPDPAPTATSREVELVDGPLAGRRVDVSCFHYFEALFAHADPIPVLPLIAGPPAARFPVRLVRYRLDRFNPAVAYWLR